MVRRRFFTVVAVFALFAVNFAKARSVDIPLATGDTLRVEAYSEQIIRVRLSRERAFKESLLERYGIVRTDWPEVNCEYKADDATATFTTAGASLEVNKAEGTLVLKDKKGQVRCRKIMPLASRLTETQKGDYQQRQESLAEYFKGENRQQSAAIIGDTTKQVEAAAPKPFVDFMTPTYFSASFALGETERFYGLGSASGKRIQLRGHGYRNWALYQRMHGMNNDASDWQQTEIPIPLVMSTGGWGIFINTTWVHFVDIGRYLKEEMFFWGPQGELDFCLLVGDTLPELIKLYTDITGKPRLMPLFGYGLTYIGNITQNQSEILNDVRKFREMGIPCDVIGLEPQWMQKFYDFSHEKKWNQDKFYMPDWLRPYRSGTMVGALDRMGFKLSLWLCCEDDFTLEAERQVARRENRSEQVPADPKGWFEHLKPFVDDGVRMFKMDPGRIIEEHLDRTYFNGRSDLENHNLTQILYHKQMNEGYQTHTGKRAMTYYNGGYAGVQHWGACWMGDNGGGQTALGWMLSLGLSGHMNTTCDMYPLGNGLHFGMLQPWSQLNNWAHCLQPWFLGEEGEAMFKAYAQLRYRLLPYIYATAFNGYLTSMPIMRAMPLVYPNVPELADCTSQYMLGDSLLVVALTNDVVLPPGKWIDYWTGETLAGPKTFTYQPPKDRAGALFVKAGAIIPCWPAINYVGHKPAETITLEVYPEGDSEFTLYEDDGDSLDYLKGAVAQTQIICRQSGDQTTVAIASRQGAYAHMPVARGFDVWVYGPRPQEVTVNGKVETAWGYDQDRRATKIMVTEDPQKAKACEIVCRGR